MTQFTIITICKEPLLSVLRFVAWHRQMGASKIVLYFDDPDDQAIAYLAHLPFVEVIRCTPKFWHSIGISAQRAFVPRQIAALTHGYRRCQEGWVGVLDTDELFYDSNGRLIDWLEGLPAAMRVVRLKVAEAICYQAPSNQQIYDRYFRFSQLGKDFTEVYGDYWPLILDGAGTVGHFRGKSLARAGLRVEAFLQHWPVDPQGFEIRGPHVSVETGRLLLHFFEGGWQEWRRKIEWRLRSGSIACSLADHLNDMIVEKAGQGEELETFLQDVYRELHVFDDARIAKLRSLGGLHDLSRDILQPARQLFGAELIDRLNSNDPIKQKL